MQDIEVIAPKKKRPILKTFLAIIVVYLILLISTMGIILDFRDCVLGRTESIDERNQLLSYEIPKAVVYDSVKIRIVPIFAIYGLSKGLMVVHYEVTAYSNGRVVYGSMTSFSPLHLSTWKLARIDGEWIVVEIDEHP